MTMQPLIQLIAVLDTLTWPGLCALLGILLASTVVAVTFIRGLFS